MRSRNRAARIERRQFRRLTKDLSSLSRLGKPQRPPRHLAKDFLGAVATLAIIGAILLEVTNGLASRCRPGLSCFSRMGGDFVGSGNKPRAHAADGLE